MGRVGLQLRKPIPISLAPLYEKRLQMREITLGSFVESFRKHVRHEFADENFMTICDRCLCCIKKGSVKEFKLAAQFIGLLAITTSSMEYTHEVYQEISKEIPVLLKPKSDSIELLSCLATVTFFGASHSEETQSSMQILWELIMQHKKDSNIDKADLTPKELPAAITAWLFMLTALDGCRISPKHWKGATTYFLDILQDHKDDNNVLCTMSCIALCFLLELGSSFEKFTTNADKDVVATKMLGCIKGKACRVVVDCLETYSISQLASEFIRDGNFSAIIKNIGRIDIIMSSWSQFIQYVFLRKFIGDGFRKHLSENEVVRAVFEFSHPPVPDLSIEKSMLNFDKVVVQCYLPKREQMRRSDSSQKRMFKSPCSNYSKASARLLAKKRDISWGHKTGILVEEQEL